MTLAFPWLHICSELLKKKEKSGVIGTSQRCALSSKTSNKKATGIWLESNLRTSNLSFSNYLKVRGSVWCRTACALSIYIICTACARKVLLLSEIIPPVLKEKPSSLHCQFFLWGSDCLHIPNVILICVSLPFITELFLLTQTKWNSPWTNYFSFLIGRAASLSVWAYGYS